MSAFPLGLLCGLVFGVLAAASMLPMQFPDKKRALLGAFFSRFAIGVCIGFVAPGHQGWGTGAVIGWILTRFGTKRRQFSVLGAPAACRFPSFAAPATCLRAAVCYVTYS